MDQQIKKHFRLTMHFTIIGDESKIPTTGVQFQPHPNSTRTGDDALWHEHDDRMRRLFEAVLSNERALRLFLESRVASWLTTETDQHWDEILFDDAVLDKHNEVRLENLLYPAIATLSKEDRKVFTRQVANEVFFDNIEEFLDCFSTELEAVELQEVEVEDEA